MGAGTSLPYLKAWRQKRALGVAYVSARSGITRETIWALEAGRHAAQAGTIERLAGTLRLTPEQLVSVRPDEQRLHLRKNPPITAQALRFALDWYRRVR